MREKVFIEYSKERVVLSDVLPYETPLIFSNRYFYHYLRKRERSVKDKKFKAKSNKAYSEIENILFATSLKNQPFRFNISHKENDFRELNIIHPHNQIKVVDFYEKHKTQILYFCSLSRFSIRKPTSVAKFSFYNDILHKKSEDGNLEHCMIEQDDNEYENLKSFFTYQKYSNIHKFYESYQFHRCEKKFNKLLKIDIAKCFDSIYTHSISWAIFNKTIVKDNIDESRQTFPGKFDSLMQNLNANETNGIVIGPEFSRIFAELILQEIDKNIYDRLLTPNEFGNRLIIKKDYEIFRYVDDYFIFYNSDVEKDMILKEVKLSLKEYNLHISDSKSIVYDKPIITEISLAKQQISDLFNDHLKLKETNVNDDAKTELYFSSNNVITRFKSIIKETRVDYKDIMNYSLAVLDNKTKKIINKWQSLSNEERNHKIEKQFEKGFWEILDVSFFLYSVSPRVNSTIKLCLILNKIISFLKKNKTNNNTEPFSKNSKHNIFKKISDEISLILQKNKSKKETQVETLYLLIALTQLGREYRLAPKVLCSYFNIEYSDKKITIKTELNYFSITVLLFYIKDIQMYLAVKDELKKHILNRFEEHRNLDWKSNTELVLLLMDVLTCPYLNEKIYTKDRKELLDYMGKFKIQFLKPIHDTDAYSVELKELKKEFYNLNIVKRGIMNSHSKKFTKCISLYLQELSTPTFFAHKGYKREEDLSNCIDLFLKDCSKSIEKYKFKKEVLSLLYLTSNQINLIESQEYWFIKWTDFDFGMELQAKRSQEVY